MPQMAAGIQVNHGCLQNKTQYSPQEMAVHHHREAGPQNGVQHELRKKVGATKLKFFGWLADTYPLPSPPNQEPAATPGSGVAARGGATAVGPPGCRGRWPRVPPPLSRCGLPVSRGTWRLHNTRIWHEPGPGNSRRNLWDCLSFPKTPQADSLDDRVGSSVR